MSDPGPTHQPYGQNDPYGQQPGPQPSPYGQQPSYGMQPAGDRRPGTVTAAAWITILFSAISAALFYTGVLNAITQTIAWCIIFYFASAGGSAAYLTVSEIFPLEVRAKAIAVFFAIAQCFGALGPVIYGALIGDGTQPIKLFLGYLLGAIIGLISGTISLLL